MIEITFVTNGGKVVSAPENSNLLRVSLRAAFVVVGVGLYGSCPGTGVAAMDTGSIHATVGFSGRLVGGVLYALSFSWVEANIQKVAALGKVRLPDITGVPDWGWFAILAAIAGVVFWLIETRFKPTTTQ